MNDHGPSDPPGRPLTVISIRELSRNTCALVKLMEKTGTGFLILRSGNPVAKLEPLSTVVGYKISPSTQRLAPDGSTAEPWVKPAGPVPMDDEELDALGLSELEKRVLLVLTKALSPDRIVALSGVEQRDYPLALVGLQNKGLARQRHGFFEPTLDGDRARGGLSEQLHPKVTDGKPLRNTDETTSNEPDGDL